jgi:hypothetical protein
MSDIILPSEIKQSFESISEDEMQALRWVGYLFVYNILSKKVAGFIPFLSDSELITANLCGEAFQFDNSMIRGSCLWCVAGLIERGYADVSAIGHVDAFFEDLLKMGVKG